MALPRGAMGLSAVCDCGFPDHTHLLFWIQATEWDLNRILSKNHGGPVEKLISDFFRMQKSWHNRYLIT